MSKLEKIYRNLIGKLHVQATDRDGNFYGIYIPATVAEKALPEGKHLTDCYDLFFCFHYGDYRCEQLVTDTLKEMESVLYGASKTAKKVKVRRNERA